MMFEKMLQVDQIEAGSQKVDVKDDDMVRSQEEIMDQIESDRMRLKGMREDG